MVFYHHCLFVFVYLNGTQLQDRNVQMLKYADDMLGYAGLRGWCKSRYLLFNADKMKALVFHFKRSATFQSVCGSC